ncbi:MAG: DUF2818 family protein [Zoogloea sp.]|nr:DUF2818 family protein [Zoogloea sp.]
MSESVVPVLLAVSFVAANLPFLSERILFIRKPASGRKHFGWRLLEVLLAYLLVGLATVPVESSMNGSRYPQGWEFYAVTFCMFVVFAYPGFVFRYFWLSRRKAA